MPNYQIGASRRGLQPALPSLNFLFLTLLFSVTGALLWHHVVEGRFIVFVFVLAGWIVSLCLHEFAHAMTAYLGGDRAVAQTGYLDLDPARYSDPLLSLVLPVFCILIGGFGLPGGAIFVNTNRLRSRLWEASVAAAGPLMNLLFLIGLAGIYWLLPEKESYLGAGLGVLALFESTAIIINLLPFPGLDGFGIILPFLPPDVAVKAAQVGAVALLILFLLIWLTKLGFMLIRVGLDVTAIFGFSVEATAAGFGMLKLF